jgi:simple sugar transport system ATP-binding protein
MPVAANHSSEPVIEARKVGKRYGHVTALEDVDFAVYPGEVVGLVGDNGAGKSTLVSILAGATHPTTGDLFLSGVRATMRSPHDARRQGIETVYQDLALAPDLTITENLFLGRERKQAGVLGLVGWLDRRGMNRRAAEELARLGIQVESVRERCDSLSGGQRQAVAVARAVAWGRHLVLMDEPTAALGVEEQHRVAELIEGIRQQGTPVVLVSHNLPQVHDICDRIVVLRRGRVVADLARNAVSIEDVVMWITGARLRGEALGT